MIRARSRSRTPAEPPRGPHVACKLPQNTGAAHKSLPESRLRYAEIVIRWEMSTKEPRAARLSWRTVHRSGNCLVACRRQKTEAEYVRGTTPSIHRREGSRW